MNSWADALNGSLELLGGLFIAFSIARILRDKEVRGISWIHVGFFTIWGLWNLFYYPHLGQTWSFIGGIGVFVANSIYLALLIYFSRNKKRVADLYIETFTGKRLYVLNPSKEAVCIDDIAHALANNCRYNGHTKKFYSVAEHCCILADYVLNRANLGPIEALRTLLHDSAEAYITDVPKPFKQELPDYQAIERRLEAVVLPAFGFSSKLPAYLKELDRRVVRDERMQAMSRSGNTWKHDSETPLGVTIEMWDPERAEKEFIIRYHSLRQMIQQEMTDARQKAIAN